MNPTDFNYDNRFLGEEYRDQENDALEPPQKKQKTEHTQDNDYFLDGCSQMNYPAVNNLQATCPQTSLPNNGINPNYLPMASLNFSAQPWNYDAVLPFNSYVQPQTYPLPSSSQSMALNSFPPFIYPQTGLLNNGGVSPNYLPMAPLNFSAQPWNHGAVLPFNSYVQPQTYPLPSSSQSTDLNSFSSFIYPQTGLPNNGGLLPNYPPMYPLNFSVQPWNQYNGQPSIYFPPPRLSIPYSQQVVNPAIAKPAIKKISIEQADKFYKQIKAKIEQVINPASAAIQQLKEEYKEVCQAFVKGVFPSKPEGLSQELMPYQWFGYKWMEILCQLGIGGCLADGMGLGKTIQSIALIQSLINKQHLAGAKARILISCPANLISNWIRELEVNCPHLKNKVAEFKKDEQSDAWIQLISHQKLRLLAGQSEETAGKETVYLFNQEWDLIIMDEFHTFLNTSTSETAVTLLRQNSQGKGHGFITLTGTPMPNNLIEIYRLNMMLNPKAYFKSVAFKQSYIQSAQQTLKQLLFAELKTEESEILDEMEMYVFQLIEILCMHFMLRRQNSSEEFKTQTAIMQAQGKAIQPLLPIQSEEKISYPFTDLQLRIIAEITRDLDTSQNLEQIRQQGALALFNQQQKKTDEEKLDFREYVCLQQNADHPTILLKSKSLMEYMGKVHADLPAIIKNTKVDYQEPSKLKEIIDLVKHILQQNPQDKILIFTSYIEMGSLICKGLKKLKAPISNKIKKVQFLSSNIAKNKRPAIIDDFQSADGPPVLIAGRKLGSVGWNCVSANHLVIIDPWWSPNDDDQCIGRLHRIGQTKPVHVYRMHNDQFIVDSKMEKLRQEKKAWCELILSADTTNIKQKIQELIGRNAQTTTTQISSQN